MTPPPVPDSFHWTHESWGLALRCGPLGAVAPHLFTTRQLQLTDPTHAAALAAAVGASSVVQLTQVHGNAVTAVRRGTPVPEGQPEGDVLVSDSPGAALVVRAADCAPILLGDRRTGAVAAVHAGWRGTSARAAAAALGALAREFGTRPADVVAAIGPAIGSCCYEVGPDLVDAFAAAGHERHLIDRWFVTTPPPRGRGRGSGPWAGTRLHLDVPGANRDQLVLAGVPEEQVHVSGLCTAMHLGLLTSYRAERDRAGRIAGAIRCAGSS